MAKIMVTVGGSPLAAYLAVMSRRPSVNTVVLVCGREVADGIARLRTALDVDGITSTAVSLDDPNDYHAIRRDVAAEATSCDGGCDLTGGTATMTLALADEFREGGGHRPRTFVDDASGSLRFVGSHDSLPLATLTWGCIQSLNQHKFKFGTGITTPENDAQLVREWLESRDTAEPSCPTQSKVAKALERWVAALMSPAGNHYEYDDVTVNPGGHERTFQVDAAAMAGHRLYVVSCTTSVTLKTVKLKGFEVAGRARQLAGGLARSAIVAPLDQSDICLVRKDMEGATGDPRSVPEVFGIRDLRQWINETDRTNTSVAEWMAR